MKILVDGQTLITPEINRGIGVYFKTALTSLIENDMSCEWYITVPDKKCLEHLSPFVNNRVQPIVRIEFNPNHIYSNGYALQSCFSSILLEETVSKKIDVYWNPNPLMANVFFPVEKLYSRMVVTIHDLIPLVFEDRYLKRWPEALAAEYLDRLRRIGDWADDLIFVSMSTQRDFHKLVPGARSTGKVVYLGVEKHFQDTPLKVKNVNNPYVLFVGGFDYRKNMEKALEAFARLITLDESKELTRDLKFVVVCSYTPEAKAAYEDLAKALGVGDRLVLTSYVSDSKLQKLYQNCRVFFFPSLYEGFGLPVLEAMASGVPVVISKTSSLQEIGGNQAFYCDPYNVDDMAGALLQVLKDDGGCIRRAQTGAVNAQQFTWEKTARETLKILRQSNAVKVPWGASKRVLAYASPMPPQRTGIANYYSKNLLPHLARHFDIDVFWDGLAPEETVEGVRKAYPLGQLEDRCDDYDGIIYHLGNNSLYHKNIYDLAWRIPGIAVLHDYNLHPFMLQSYLMKGNHEMYQAALEEGYGKEGAEHFLNIMAKRQRPDIWKYPMSHAIVKRSKATIVHHHWVRAQFPRELPVYVIPLLAQAYEAKSEKEKSEAFRAKYGIKRHEFVIGCYGFINSNKRPEKVVGALSILRQKGYPARVVFAGELSPEIPHLVDLIKRSGLQEAVIITGYLNDEEYIGSLAAADLAVNLRYPTMGEASATLVEALAYGKATIVSKVNQYMEYPENVCWKVDVGQNEINQLADYIEVLLKEPAVRERQGLYAQEFASNAMGVETVSEEYWHVISKCIEGDIL